MSSPGNQQNENIAEIVLRPVGFVKSDTKKPSLVAENGDLAWKAKALESRTWRSAKAEVIVNSELTGILDGIEEFSHILVLYWAHHVSPEGRTMIKARPMGRKDLPLVGIFATCSPARPNTICATVVRLLERKGNVLTVEGLDALNGSPVLDIKPYNQSYFPAEKAKVAGWLARIQHEIIQSASQSRGQIPPYPEEM